MYDKELVLEILNQIRMASQTIIERFEPIEKASDFTQSPSGKEKLDSICMQLIVIGESLKKLDRVTNNELLDKYKQIDWKKAKGLRDIITHQYFDINEEAIYNICETKIRLLNEVTKVIIKDL